MIEIKIENWKHYIDILEKFNYVKHANGYKHIQFRGQSNKEWKLESSLKRIIKDAGINEKEALFYERQARNEYSEQVHLLDEKGGFLDTMSEEALFIDMQHFTCPTRVIDWSLSPFIGLYFAVSENIEMDGAVFMWNSALYNGAMNDKYGILAMEIKSVDLSRFTDFEVVQLVLLQGKINGLSNSKQHLPSLIKYSKIIAK